MSKLLSVSAFTLLLALGAQAAEINGRVTNGTTNQPLAGASVNLIALREQMVPVREGETDSQGRFRFVIDANPNERFLVQVPYRGVIYSQPALFTSGDTITVDLTVFEADAKTSDISVEAHTIFLQPQPDHVQVSEFYLVRNTSQPPRAYAPDSGSFRFALPGTVGDLQVSAGRSDGVSLRQQPQPTGIGNTFRIDFAFKPGESEVQVSYALPLQGNTFDLNLPLVLKSARRHVAVPREGVKLTGKDLTEIQQTQAPQVRVFLAAVEPPASLSLHIEVDPAALEAAAAAAPPPAAEGAAEGQSQVRIVPQPVNAARWYIVALSLIVLFLGLYYLYALEPAPKSADVASSQPGRRRRDESRAHG